MLSEFLCGQHHSGSSSDASSTPRLHLDAQGSGPVLVLAHGLGGSARNFIPQARALRSSHKVWLYDARGHARSESPVARDAHGWPALVGDFGRVATDAWNDTSNPVKRPFVVGGLSLGAATALSWALQPPPNPMHAATPRADGLVLAAYPDSSESQRRWALDFSNAIDTEGLEQAGKQYVWGPGAVFESADAGMIRRGFMEHSPAALAAILRQALANIPDIVSLAPALEKLSTPTLIIVGSDDSRSLAASRVLATRIPNSRLAVIEHAGHVVNLSQPGAFNQELTQFIANLPIDDSSTP